MHFTKLFPNYILSQILLINSFHKMQIKKTWVAYPNNSSIGAPPTGGSNGSGSVSSIGSVVITSTS